MKKLLIITLFSLNAFAATAIRNVRLFDGQKVIENATVVFDQGVITAAGKNVAVPEGAEVIDGSGKTLLPGFIDAHTHAYGPALERALRFGVTTELDMFTGVDLLKQWKSAQAAGNVASRADIYSAGTLVTVAGGHGTEYFKIPVFAHGDDPQKFIDARIAEGSDYIKLVLDDGKAYGIHFETLTKDDLRALIAAAHRRGKLAVVHVGALSGARDAIDAGADGLAHIFEDTKPDADFAKFAAAHHVFVVPTLTVEESVSGVASGASLTTDERLKPFLNGDEIKALRGAFPKREGSTRDVSNAFLAVQQLHDAHVPILAGTDSGNPGTTHGASIHRELELLVKAGLTPVEALTAATATPAKTFQLNDRGRIAKGLRADLVLVNGDPTHDITATRDIATIWKGGIAFARQPETKQSQATIETIDAPKLSNGTLTDFESGDTKSAFGAGWMISTDQMMGGKSEASMNVADGGANGTAKSLHVVAEIKRGSMFPWAGAMYFAGSTPMKAVDLSSKKGITFFAKGDRDISVLVFAESKGRIPAQKTVHAGADWTELTIPWTDLGMDGHDFQAILFGGTGAEKSEFWIDEVRLK